MGFGKNGTRLLLGNTLQHVLYGKPLPFPTFDNDLQKWSLVPRDLKERLAWLNEPDAEQIHHKTKRALHHPEFRWPVRK